MSKSYFVSDHIIDVNYKCEVTGNKLDVYKTNKNVPRIIKTGVVTNLNPDYYYFFKTYLFEKIFTFENVLSDFVIIRCQNFKHVIFNRYYIMEIILTEDFDAIEVTHIINNGDEELIYVNDTKDKESGYYQFNLLKNNKIIYNCQNPFGNLIYLSYWPNGDHIFGDIIDSVKSDQQWICPIQIIPETLPEATS